MIKMRLRVRKTKLMSKTYIAFLGICNILFFAPQVLASAGYQLTDYKGNVHGYFLDEEECFEALFSICSTSYLCEFYCEEASD